MKLEGKTATITGAGFGIGKGIAQAIAKEDAKLVLAARNGQRLQAAADELRSQGATVISVPTDVSHERCRSCGSGFQNYETLSVEAKLNSLFKHQTVS